MSLSVSGAPKHVEVVTFDWFKQLRSSKNDTTYVVNFWATWCAPCIAELPEFERLHQQVAGKKIKVILVSLDFYKKLPITVIPYLEKKGYQAEVVLLNEPDYNSWIDKVDRKWGGSIPATLIFNNQENLYHFIEGQTTYDELMRIVSASKTNN
jgi:thiol-disulfide isomerase/thioredoxin